MSVPYAYSDNPLTGKAGSFQSLEAEESFHLCRVLRLRQGNTVMLTDGQGSLAESTIVEADARETILQLKADPVFFPARNYTVHIAIAPTRHPDRLEWFVEKVTETGVDKISLIICEHSEKWNVKVPRLQRLMIAAMKQSQQCRLPVLNGPLTFMEMMQKSVEDEKWIGYCEGDPELLSRKAGKMKNVVVAIGPEGDFSPAEINSALANGFKPISLGPTRLRTETAGFVACQIIHTLNELEF